MSTALQTNSQSASDGGEFKGKSRRKRRGPLVFVEKRRSDLESRGRLLLVEDMVFSKPTKDARLLAILQALSEDSSLSQYSLGEQSKLSGARVNAYLKELAVQGIIEYEPVNGKSYRYQLTTQGELLRRELFAQYCSETIKSYTAIKNSIANRLQDLASQGITKVALFGASETCEVALTAIAETPLTVVALLDNDRRKHGKIFHGHVICHPAFLEYAPCEAVVITSYGCQQDIYDQLKPLKDRKQWEIIRL